MPPVQPPRLAPRRFSPARLAFFRGVERVAKALGGRRFYRATQLSPPRVREERIDVGGLPVELDGLSIVHLSDVHAGPFLGRGDLARTVERANALAPDLAVFTGDLITHDAEEAWWILDDLAALRAPLGVYGVFGNHDYHGRREREIRAAYSARGVAFLCDEARALRDGALWLIGLEDLEEKKADVDAFAALPGRAFVVALCHNPRGAPACFERGASLVLSGHTHGGQINLPLVRRFAPRHPGDRIDGPRGTLIVSRGLGALGLPVRVRARAELVRIVLRAARRAERGAA
jgi:predicted MPP superfamily phosphohydrolase